MARLGREYRLRRGEILDFRGADIAGVSLFDAQWRSPGLALPLWLEKRGGSFATTIQLVEADRLCNPDGKPDSKSLRGGIEIDSYGAAKAYWIRKNHPGDYLLSAGSEKDWQRIPVETPFGRRRVLHIADLERSGQSRGKPLLTSVMP